MEHRHRSEDYLDIPDLYTKCIPSSIEKCEFECKDDRVYYCDDNVCNPKSVSVACSAIELSWCENGRHYAHSVVVATASVCPDPGEMARLR